MSILDKAFGIGQKVVTIVRPHLPTIAVVGGSIAVVSSTFFACKATLKVDEVFEQHNAMMKHISDTAAKLPKDSYTEKDMKKDKLQTYSMTAGKLFRLYGPAIGLGLAGFASIFAGFGMIKRWHALAVSSVAALDESFANYRKQVIEEFGAEVDEKFTKRRGDFKQVEKKTIDDEGNETVEKVDAIDLRDIVEDDFTRVFDWHNPNWENDYLINSHFLENLEMYYTKQLQSHRMDHVFLNTILKDLGFRETGIGHFYGWTDKTGCEVNFGCLPFITVWDSDEDGQFPMILPIDIYDDDQYEQFRQAYIEDDKKVGYILKFNVDCNENGIPRQIYNDVYGGKKAQ